MALQPWVGLTDTAITLYTPGVEHILPRYRPELALCMKKAKKAYGKRNASWQYTWQIQVDRPEIQGLAPGEEVTFERHRLERQATIGSVKVGLSTSLTREDVQISSGRQGLVNLVEERQKALEESLSLRLGEHLLTNDGNASGTTQYVSGMESFLGYTTTALSDNKRLTPSDTYAGFSTTLGTFGGTSEADDQYVVFTPTIVNYAGSGFSSFGTTFADRCLEVLDFAFQHVRYRNTSPEFVDGVFMHPAMFTDVIGKIRTKDQYLVQRGKDESNLVDMGFEALKYGTAELIPTQSVSDGAAYGISCKNVTWWSIYDKMFDVEKDYYMPSQTYRWFMYLFGNIIFKSPNRHFKLTDGVL